MLPELFATGDGTFVLYSYGVFLGLAIVLGALLGTRNAIWAGIPAWKPLVALAFGVPCGFLGARIQYALADPQAFAGILDLIDFRGGRFYSFGAAAGGIAGTMIAARVMRLDVVRMIELLVPGLALALSIGRVGCFLAGCGYGRATSLPWGVRFPSGSPAHTAHAAEGQIEGGAVGSLPVHPTQLYEVVLLGLLCLVLQRMVRTRAPRAVVIASFMAGYGAIRLGNEFLRGDADRGFLGPLSSTQWASLAMLILVGGTTTLAIARRRSSRGRPIGGSQ